MQPPIHISLFLINFEVLQNIEKELNTVKKKSNKPAIIFEIKNHANWDYEQLIQYTQNKLVETFKLLQKVCKKLVSMTNTIAIVNENTLGAALSIALACQKIEIKQHSFVSFAFPEIKANIPAVIPKINNILKKNIYFPVLISFLNGNPINIQQAQSIQIVSELATPLTAFTRLKTFLYFWAKNNYTWLFHKKHINFATQKNANLKYIFAKNISNTNNKLYLLTTEFKQKTEKTNLTNPQPTPTLCVIGAGRMGGGIALAHAQTSAPTLLYDQHPPTLQQAYTQIKQHAEQNKIPLNLLTLNNLNEIKKATFIIESIAESLTLKQELLAKCEAITADNCIFATNTSSIPIQQLAQNAQRPEQVIGMHYFFPVPNKPLIEIVTTPKTSDYAKNIAIEVAQKQNKYYILVNDCPCFFANRILVPILNEAMLLLQKYGITALNTINNASLQAGFSFAPFDLLDETGIDLARHIFNDTLINFFKNQNPYFEKSNLIDTLYENNFRGKKNNNGFWAYNTQNKKEINPLLHNFLHKKTTNTHSINTQQVAKQLITATIVESLFCLQDQTIQNPHHANIGSVYGAGFPMHTGGVFKYIDQQGLTNILKMIDQVNTIDKKQKYVIPQILIDYEKKAKNFCS